MKRYCVSRAFGVLSIVAAVVGSAGLSAGSSGVVPASVGKGASVQVAGGGAKAAKGELAFVLTEPRVQEFPAVRWVYLTKKTRLADGQVARDGAALMEKFTPEVVASLRPVSGPIIEYIGNTGDPATEFEMRVGVPVAAGTAAPEGFSAGELPAYRAYTLVFSGPVDHLSKAYTMAYQRMFEDGKFPSGSSREHVLYWEAPESPNNVSVIQIGLLAP